MRTTDATAHGGATAARWDEAEFLELSTTSGGLVQTYTEDECWEYY